VREQRRAPTEVLDWAQGLAHSRISGGDMTELPLTVYTPSSPLRDPKRLVREMFRDLAASRELAWRLFIRDVSAQYRQSILGYVWVFIPPLVASLPFVYLNEQGIVKMGDTPVPFGAYAIIGTIIWQVFVDAINAPLRTVTQARPMLARINLPREAILLSGLAQVLFGFLVRLVLLLGVLAWFRIAPPATALLFPIGILSLILVGFVLGILITPMGLLYNDVQQTLPIATTFLMLLTPVVYPVPVSGFAATVAALNPLTSLVTATRDWLTVGSTTQMAAFTIITLIAAAGLFSGWIVLRVAMPHLIARIGS
jgi:lipopolysaccharide transport system permease protein